MNKFVFVTLPSVELERPPAAAGALVPVIKKAGLEPIVKENPDQWLDWLSL